MQLVKVKKTLHVLHSSIMLHEKYSKHESFIFSGQMNFCCEKILENSSSLKFSAHFNTRLHLGRKLINTVGI